LTVPATGASYTIRVRVYTLLNPTQNFVQKEFKLVVTAAGTPGMTITNSNIGNKLSMEVGDYFAVNLFGKTGSIGTGVNPKYKFILGEPWKAPLMTQTYSSSAIFTERITAPGVYMLQSYVSHNAYSSYDDGLLQYSTVTRKTPAGGAGTSPGTFGGIAQFYSCAVRVNDGLTPLSADELSYSTSPLYPGIPVGGPPASSSASPTWLTAGDVVDFDAVGAGLFTGTLLSPLQAASSDYEYSFYRLDVNGYREVKSWSSEGTLSWKPFAPGSLFHSRACPWIGRP